ncbi:pyridoxine kinase [Alphaproteobacteria bacterium]
MNAILSIQSHVVYGYAGNRIASFVIQRLGMKVSAINTVQFSNHTGYKCWEGKMFSSAHIRKLITGLEDLGILGFYDAVLSGYLGKILITKAIIEVVQKIKKLNPSSIYCCDPVMGDAEIGFFVNPNILPHVVKMILVADIITPNQFEASIISGITIRTLGDAQKAAQKLHSMGPSIVIIKSIFEENRNNIITLLSTGKEQYLVITPYITLTTSAGCGDLLAALFLTRYLQNKSPVLSLEYAVSSIYDILVATKHSASLELNIIESQDNIVNPTYIFKAQKISCIDYP